MGAEASAKRKAFYRAHEPGEGLLSSFARGPGHSLHSGDDESDDDNSGTGGGVDSSAGARPAAVNRLTGTVQV